MPDRDGYPTKAELQGIYDFVGSPREFVDYINSIWWHDGFTVENGKDDFYGKIKRLYLSTWGWSGNEETIDYINGTWFRFRYWVMTRRGGHYKFEVPLKDWETKTDFIGAMLDKDKSKVKEVEHVAAKKE